MSPMDINPTFGRPHRWRLQSYPPMPSNSPGARPNGLILLRPLLMPAHPAGDLVVHLRQLTSASETERMSFFISLAAVLKRSVLTRTTRSHRQHRKLILADLTPHPVNLQQRLQAEGGVGEANPALRGVDAIATGNLTRRVST